MKQTAILLFSLAAIFILALIYNIQSDKKTQIDDPRSQMFSTLVDDESYRSEFMDVVKEKYPAIIVETAFSLAEDNPAMKSEMLNQLAAICYADPHMCKMIMGMTLSICDIDKEKCSMMSGMILHHQEALRCMMQKMNENGFIDKGTMENILKSNIGNTQNIHTPDEFTSRP